ncbi:hypothetical protein HQ585_12935 [candidate division KSB1 bacterium]|nr:hypothetical protein [candidate division KSB1 bacterium]
MRHFKNSCIVPCVIFISGLCISPAPSHAQNTTGKKNIFAERPLIHVLGPSPALSPNADDSAVDSQMMESSDVFKDLDTYYWYYHARSKDQERWPNSYRLCVATAPSPLGPWKRYAEGNPILDTGKEDEWDHGLTACACILKEDSYETVPGTETYYMWYFAFGGKDFPGFGAIGLATADNPLGPWKKYEGNPVMEWPKGGVYPGSVSKIDGKFYMFAQHPVSVADQGAFCIAYADKPEGPWKLYEGNPVLSPGDWGSWDDGGFSEACARYHEGVYHCVYGGTKVPKIESLGYAWSFDGINWEKYAANPVVSLGRVPDAAGFAEVHILIEGSYIYVYHTLRYFTGDGTARGVSSYPPLKVEDFGKESMTSHILHNNHNVYDTDWDTEDLAIQVLTIDPQYKISFPILMIDSLDPRQSTRIEACLPMGLEAASKLAIATECTYDSKAKAGLRLHVRGSNDGVRCDTEDLYTFDIPARAGQDIRKTFDVNTNVRFAKVVVENLDKSNSVK